jgi:PAS domain S-box-containing protein
MFDGQRWQRIDSKSLSEHSIIHATADREDGIWLSAIPNEGPEILRIFHAQPDGRLRQVEPANRNLLLHRPGIVAEKDFIWLYSYAGLFRAPRNQLQQFVKVAGPVVGHFGSALSQSGTLAFQCVEGIDGPAGLAFWQNQKWSFWPLVFPRAFHLAKDGTVMAADGNSVHLSPEVTDRPSGTMQLPINTSINHMLKGAHQDYWFGSDAGVFRYRPKKEAPETIVRGADKRIRQDANLRLQVTGLKRFEGVAKPAGFTYSWRFDQGTWTEFQSWPEQGLPLANLSGGDHTIEVRTQDATSNIDATPERYAFSVLSIPLQERAWFLPALGSITGLISFLSYLVWRSRQRLAEHAAQLEDKVAERTADLQKDIERREHVERELSVSESRFRGVFNSTHQLMGLMTIDGRLLEANSASLSLIDARMEDVRGRFFWETPWWNHSTALQQRIREAIQEAAQGKPVMFETHLLRKSGEIVEIDFSIKPIYDESRQVLFLIPEGHDITARKRAETERQSLQEQLAQAQKMESVGRLAGGVAHDFNNLLTAILGNLELVLHSTATVTPENQEFLLESQRAGKRASELTRQLLAFSRKQILETKPVDLNQLILGFGKMLNRLIGEDLEVRTHLEPRLGMVKADAAQMEQVLLNLALNARDAMPKGGRLTIETNNVELDEHYASIYPEVRAGRWIRLVISDTGCGMDAETQKRVFEPFFTTKPVGKGTGLGLATVYGVVKQHDGHITVYSEPGKGTTFKIYLPMLESYDPDEPDAKSHEPMPGNETILVVEDEPSVRKLTCRMLRNHGYQVIEAKDGPDAIVQARQSNFIDLLLTDVIMPGMSGMDVYQAIQSQCPGIKVLYCSGYTGSVIAHHGILENDLQFMQKPFSAAVLTRKVRETLDGRH